MSSSMATEVDGPYARDPQTRDAARRYLERTGNADLAEMLGLAEAAPADRCRTCPACNQPYRSGRWECRYADCSRGPAARGVSRDHRRA